MISRPDSSFVVYHRWFDRLCKVETFYIVLRLFHVIELIVNILV